MQGATSVGRVRKSDKPRDDTRLWKAPDKKSWTAASLPLADDCRRRGNLLNLLLLYSDATGKSRLEVLGGRRDHERLGDRSACGNGVSLDCAVLHAD